MRYIVIIWHQAGGRNENKIYQTWWNDQDDEAHVFESRSEALKAWLAAKMNEIHCGRIVEVTAQNCEWI